MKNIKQEIKNASIFTVDLTEKDYKVFYQKLFATLRKFSSSRKTRIVHKLIDDEVIKLALFTGEATGFLTASAIKDNTKLRRLFLNIYHFDDSVSATGVVTLAGKIKQIKDKIVKEKTYLTDKQILNIEKLQEELDETVETLLDNLDYVKIIDGIYFEYLRILALITVTQEGTAKAKVVTAAADLIASIIKKIYLKISKTIESEMHQLIEAVSVYFILTYYYGETGPYALAKMKQGFKEEVIESIKRVKVTKFNKFTELAILLKELNIINVTESAFEQQLKKMYGNYAYSTYIERDLVDFIAVNANLNYRTQLFNAFPIVDELHQRTEELILNEKKKLVVLKT